MISRESYAETLKRQEEKRRQRMEMEKLYEEEYRDRHMEESKSGSIPLWSQLTMHSVTE